MAEKTIDNMTIQNHISKDLAKKISEEKRIKTNVSTGASAGHYINKGYTLFGKKLAFIGVSHYNICATIYDPSLESFVENYLEEVGEKYSRKVHLDLMYIPKEEKI